MHSLPTTILAALTLVVGAASAQDTPSFGKDYAFDERKPRTALEKLIDKHLPSIVKVHGASGLATIEAYSSGVIVSKEGHILVLDLISIQKNRTRVVLHDGSVHDAELLPPHEGMGLRILKIDPSKVGTKLIPMWPDVKPTPNGTFLVSMGNCYRLAEFSEKVSAMFGVLVGRAKSGLRFRLADVDAYKGELLLTDAANNPGHYGGALITLDGRWVGLNARMVESLETNTDLSAAIPSKDLIPYLNEWVKGEVPEDVAEEERRPVYHGIRLFDRGGRRSPPAYISRVKRGSPAFKLGLRPDDLIVRVDEWPVRSCKGFREVLLKYQPGDTVTVTYKRGGTVKAGKLTFEAEKEAK